MFIKPFSVKSMILGQCSPSRHQSSFMLAIHPALACRVITQHTVNVSHMLAQYMTWLLKRCSYVDIESEGVTLKPHPVEVVLREV